MKTMGSLNQTPLSLHRIKMYAIPHLGQQCPVNFLKLFMAKTDPNATSLFNHCVKKECCRHLKKRIYG